MTTPKLAFNKRGMGRHYRHPTTGEEVPSVTNVIDVLSKPALPRWSAKMVAEAAWKMRHSLAEMGQDECVDVLKGSPWRNSGRAANRGTSIHAYLEWCANGQTGEELKLTGEAATYKAGADQFLEQYQPEFVATEFTVFGDSYAGTADFMAFIDGRLVIGDFKTSKALYPEIALQLAAIRYADTVLLREELEPMIQVDSCVGVLITPHGCEVRHVDAGEDAFRAFLACRDAWTWRKAGNPVGGLLECPASEVAS